jgi:ATP/maltotriose-dependent transcriptional regulator MalT
MKTSIFLQTKFLAPQQQISLVPRPRLESWLEDNRGKRLLLISAPAGFGKTTLLAGFFHQSKIPAAWYQLDMVDNDPAVFTSYLIEALRRTLPGRAQSFGEAALTLLENSEEAQVDYQQVMMVLINDMVEDPDAPWIAALDDYHLISNPLVHNLVDYLLENAPPGFQLLLSTRVDPPLQLARLRARDMLAELRAADLRFSPDEIRTWFELRALGLSESSLNELTQKTEGWAAALQIVVSSIRGRNPKSTAQFIADLSGTHRYIFNYLAEEVFQSLDEEQQTFLLTTAVLEQMNVDACQALLETSQPYETLETLEGANLLITQVIGPEKWYRYHQLFREFLLGKIRQEDPGALARLEQRAGQYYEQIREWELAFGHYISARAPDLAARALEQFAAAFFERGRVEALSRYLSQLDEATLQVHPELLLQQGNVYRRLGHAGQAAACYEAARHAFKQQGDHAGVCRSLTRLALLNYSQGYYAEARQLASLALKQATSDDHVERARALMALSRTVGLLTGMDEGRTLAEQAVAEANLAGEGTSPALKANLLQSLGQICWWQGDPQAAVRHCQDALLAVPEDVSPTAAKAYITMVTPYLYWRDFEKALKYAESGLEIAQTLHLVELLPSAYAALGNVLTRFGAVIRAESSLRQAVETAQRLGLASYERVMATGFLAYNLTGQGRFEEARQLAEGALWSYTGNPDTYEVYVCSSVLADVALEKNEFNEAERRFKELVPSGQKHQFRIPLAMVYFGLAYICLSTGRKEQGLAYARQSLELIEPTHALQLYLDQGSRSKVVCQALIENGESSHFLHRVLENLPTQQAPLPAITVMANQAINVRTLGQFQVLAEGQEVTKERWVSSKARDLLAYFVTFRGERHNGDRVFEALWEGRAQSGKTAFHTALSRLRKALRGETRTLKFILVETGEYWLDAARFGVDVDEFDLALSTARASEDLRRAEKWYEHAISLYQGPYLDSLYYDWVLPERRRLAQSALGALTALSGLYQGQGRTEEAIPLLHQALQIDPALEDVHCQLMKAYAALRNQAAVVRQYQQLEAILREELDVEPLESTIHLYESLLQRMPGE